MPDGNMYEFDSHPQDGSAIGRGPGTLGKNFEQKVNFDPSDPATGTGKEEDQNKKDTDALLGLSYGRESLDIELITGAEDSTELFEGLRMFEGQLESATIPNELVEHYKPPGILTYIHKRAEALKLTPDVLKKKGWLLYYDESTGEGIFKSKKFTSLAITPNSGQKKVNTPNGEVAIVVHDLGTPKEREVLAKNYERAQHELEVLTIDGVHIGAKRHLDLRDNLEGKVAWEHSTTAKFKTEHLHALHNLPDIDELAVNPENTKLGDQIEEAMFLHLIMLSSGSKQKTQDLIERPGAEFLIHQLAVKKGISDASWIRQNIGDLTKWTSDMDRDPDKTWKDETANGYRGTLTRWGNIAAFGGNPGDFSKEDEDSFINNDIGGLVESVKAAWVAATHMRVIGALASEGYVALPNGKTKLTLGEGRYESSDDDGKFLHFLFAQKEGFKGNPTGLKDMIGRMPDLNMNLYDWAQVKVKLVDGTEVRRSIWDAWLGTKEGKPIIDLYSGEVFTGKDENGKDIIDTRTGQKVKITTEREEYHRLGSLNFESLDRDFHDTYSIMKWLAGREGDGVFTNAMQVEFRPEDFSLAKLKKIWKYAGIIMNPVYMAKGSTHRYYMGTGQTDEVRSFTYEDDNFKIQNINVTVNSATAAIQRNFFRNLMTARIRSSSFGMNVLGAIRKIPSPQNPLKETIDVSEAKLAEFYIGEILNGNPKSIDDITDNYIDNTYILRRAGKPENIDQVVSRAVFAENVGRITGKNTY